MPNLTNGVYSNRPWIAPPEAAYPPQAYIGPFASNQEQNLSQAMASLTMSSEEIQQYVRPNLPQIQLFPPRFGYETREYGVDDMIDLNVPMTERVDTAKPAAQAEPSSRNTLGGGV
jgi:hypothetical protein